MAAPVAPPLAVRNGVGHDDNNTADSTITTWSTPVAAPHPEAAEIIRQIEFYFGEDNLRQDAHLLGLIKEGNGTVSLNEILSFSKMRRFKPRSAVREAIKQSELVEVTGNNKRLKRRYPLTKPITVIPKINENRKKKAIPEDKPWITKGMLKPTGFEPYATDGPIMPAEYEEDRKEYDPDNAFSSRIETAIMRFTARRKMHQHTRAIFAKFMIFGGVDCGQRQFTGGLDKQSMEDYTKKEIAELTSYYGVSELVIDGLYEDNPGDEATWIVDFEAVAKALLSSPFRSSFHWHEDEQIRTATNVLRNFYNYLLLHDVCPEYKDQLLAARKVCDMADDELPRLKEVDRRLPGGFNSACSTLFGGHYENLHASGGDWVKEDDNIGWSASDALLVFRTGIFAQGTEEQVLKLEEVTANGKSLKVVSEEDLGLTIVGIEFADAKAKEVYDDPRFANTMIRPMGKLRCVRWNRPHAPPMDLPASIVKAKKTETFEFLVEDETLKYCYLGLKIECVVKELDLGIQWIDYVEATHASFFTWLANECIRAWKEPGPPKGWMLKRTGGDDASFVPNEQGEGADGEIKDDDEPE